MFGVFSIFEDGEIDSVIISEGRNSRYIKIAIRTLFDDRKIAVLQYGGKGTVVKLFSLLKELYSKNALMTDKPILFVIDDDSDSADKEGESGNLKLIKLEKNEGSKFERGIECSMSITFQKKCFSGLLQTQQQEAKREAGRLFNTISYTRQKNAVKPIKETIDQKAGQFFN